MPLPYEWIGNGYENAVPSARSNWFGRSLRRAAIFGFVINLLILIADQAALASVDVREMPDVGQLVLSIHTQYDGATPATVDQEITQVLEGAQSALEGLSYIESSSSTGSSYIINDLSDGTDIDVAANDPHEIVSATVRQLPGDLENDPTVSKSDSNASAVLCLRRSQGAGSLSSGAGVLYEVGVLPLPDGVRKLISQNVIREVRFYLPLPL